MNPCRKSEIFLLLCFLAIIAGVPATQTCLELARHERVQATDVFRYQPTAKNLRQFEHTLEEKSWFQQRLRPQLQRFLFATLRDTGPKAVLGRDHWLFYRPDLRYLVEPDRPETGATDSKWAQPTKRVTHRESVEMAILRFRDQLRERGIALVVMPVPGKPSIYPDQVTARAAGTAPQFRSCTIELMERLQRHGIATVNLFAAFQRARASRPESQHLYLAHDTHWTPLGAQIAAETVAARLAELNLAPEAKKEFRARPLAVTRWGDILDLMQIPGLRHAFTAETVECLQVFDPALGPLVPGAASRPGTYCYPGQQSSVLVLGDSFCRIYQYAEPQALGEISRAPVSADPAGVPSALPSEGEGSRAAISAPGHSSKRLLPGSAGFISHLALALKSPVDAIVSDGGAATDVRRKLSTDPEILEDKKVVLWEFAERDIALGGQGWQDVALPRQLQ